MSTAIPPTSAQSDSETMPRTGIVDSHIHVFDPERFHYAERRAYSPGTADLTAVDALGERMNTQRFLVVQPSPYGTDNRALLDALEALGPDRARGVACVDTSADSADSAEELERLRSAGVVGIRFNRNSDPHARYGSLIDELNHHVAFCARHDMAVQLFCKAADLAEASDVITASPVPVILDHFGGVSAGENGLNGEDAVLRLAGFDNVWIKLSAPYRVGEPGPVRKHLPDFTRRLLERAGDRLIWASDWPHTGGGKDRASRDPQETEPFRDHDALRTRDELLTWIDDPLAALAILVDNPSRLFGFAPTIADGADQEGHI